MSMIYYAFKNHRSSMEIERLSLDHSSQVKFWAGLPQELSRTYHICLSDSFKPSNCLRQINPKKTNPQSDRKVNEARLPTARPFLNHDAIRLRLNFTFLWIFKRRLRWYNKFLQPLQINAAPAASKWRNIFFTISVFSNPGLKFKIASASRAQHNMIFHFTTSFSRDL